MKFKLMAALAIFLVITLLILDWALPPNLSKLNDQATVVSDSSGRPLRAFANSQGVWRYPTTVDKVSPYYLEALFNYEDRYYYYHPGVNPFAMLRAVGQAIYYQKAVSGGSTITMQVARLLHPNRRTIGGKITQMLRALQLEWRFDKTQILNFYLNIAPFGGPIEGIEAASYVYFDKSALELTPSEAALLAVLPQSPSRYRPDRYPSRAFNARNKLLKRLETFNVWDDELIATLVEEPIYADYFPNPRLAPILARRLKQRQPKAHIQTFIDGDLQEQLEHRLSAYVLSLPNKASAAAMVMHAHSGEVIAYLGSANFNDKERAGQVDMIRAIRSPGSTLKPFVYGAAIEQGLIHENSLLQDVPLIKGSYRPHNFSGGFSGPVSVKQALLRSLNIPVLQVLNHSGATALAARLNNGGLTLHWPADASANASLILGGVGTRLEKLVSAYSSLINQGQAVTPRYSIDDAHQQRFLLEPASAWIIQNILRQQKLPGRVSRVLNSTSQGPLPNIGWKTGTSYGFRDAWVVGFSGPYIIGVWVGRADAKPVPHNSGSEHALPLFLRIASQLPQTYQPVMPATVSQAQTCWPGGSLQTQTLGHNCHREFETNLYHHLAPPTLALSTQQPAQHSVNYYIEPNGKRATVLCASTEATPMTQQLWPQSLESWLKPGWRRNQLLPELSPACSAQNIVAQQPLKIISIKPGTHFVRRRDSSSLLLKFKTDGNNKQVSWFLNGELLTQSQHDFTQAGSYQLLALDNTGRVDSIEFVID